MRLTSSNQWYILILVFLGLAACQPASEHKKKDTAMSKGFSFSIGGEGRDLAKDNPYVVDNQPMGVDFYDVSLYEFPSVRFEHGAYSFDIPNPMSLMGTGDKAFAEEGIKKIFLSFVLSREPIMHEQARDQLYALLKDWQKKGWRQYYPHGSGRCYGPLVWRNKDVLYKDINEVPSLEEWMTDFSMSRYLLYANGVFVKVMVMRDEAREDVTQPGSYFLTINFTSEAEMLRSMSGWYEIRENGSAEGADTQQWKRMVPAALEQEATFRAESEAAAKLEGIAIDEAYQDPPISPGLLSIK